MSMSASDAFSAEKRDLGTPDCKESQRTAPQPGSGSFCSSNSNGNEDIFIVDWNGPDDPENPLNWSRKRKWATTIVVSAFAFITPVTSSIIAPASPQLAEHFGIDNSTELACVTSIFVLAYAFGPLVLGPLSEIYGRSRVLQLANLWYLAWNIGCGFAQNTASIMVFRFLAGLGGSAPLAIGGGVLADCWRKEERGKAVTLYSVAPVLGPLIGPVVGAWIAQKSTWRWVFYSTSVTDAVVQALGLFFLKESFAPLLLERKASQLRMNPTEQAAKAREIRSKYYSPDTHWKTTMARALTRPFRFFLYEPIVQLLGLYFCFVYGLLYIFLTTIPSVFEMIYGEDVGIAGLNYCALGIGLVSAAQINGLLLDRIYKHLMVRNGGEGKPEYRLLAMVPGTWLTPIGLFISGWTARSDIPWVVPDIGIALIGAGTVLNFICIQTYVIDAFSTHAASALASITFLRSLAGFGFPLFAPTMYSNLGYAKGNSILAAIGIVIGCPAPFILWFYGERIRKASSYASH